MKRHFFLLTVALTVFFTNNVWSQSSAVSDQKNPAIKLGKPRIVSVTPQFIEFQVTAGLLDIPRDGRIESIAFTGFTANGVRFDVDEYVTPFDVKKARPVQLPSPLICRMRVTDAARKLIGDAVNSKDKWQIDGVATVRASARKFGFRFKREVILSVSMQIDNPLPYR